MVPKDVNNVRAIYDFSRPNGRVNSLAYDSSVCYTSIDKVSCAITKASFVVKINLKAAYRSIPIYKKCYSLTGLHWRFLGEAETTFMFDAQLPFGAAKKL